MKIPGPAVRLSLFAVLAAFVIDRLHKYVQLDLLGWQGGEHISLLPVFDYILVWNTGISYGLLGSLPFFVLAAIVSAALVMLLVWWWRSPSVLVRVGLAMALGGGLSNQLDRLIYGGVADFFYFHIGDRGFYVFNLADVAISAGLCLLVLDLFRPQSKQTS